MLFPIKPICDKKKIRKDGTSIIYIQYCFSTKHRVLLNTGIAIPPDFWHADRLIIKPTLPCSKGDAIHLNKELKRMVLLTQHLVELAEKFEMNDKFRFVKEEFTPDLDIKGLILDEKRLLAYKNTVKVNTDIYYQLEDYIKCKTGKVNDKTLAIYRITGNHIKDFELFRKSPISFDSLDYNFYDSFVHFLTYDYIQKRRKLVLKGLKKNSVSKTIKHLRLFVKDRIKRKIIAPIDLSDFKSPEEFSIAQHVQNLGLRTLVQIQFLNLFLLFRLTRNTLSSSISQRSKLV